MADHVQNRSRQTSQGTLLESLFGSTAEETISPWRPAAAGMATAAALSLLFSKLWPLESLGVAVSLSQLHHPTVAPLIVSGAAVLLSFLAGISAAFALTHAMSRTLLQAAALGAWAGPVALLVTGRSPLLLLAAVLLAPATARLLHRSEDSDPDECQMFDPLAAGDGGFVRTAAASLALHMSVLAVGNQQFATASLLICSALATMQRLAWRRRSSEPHPRFASLLGGAILFAFLGTVPLGSGAGPSVLRSQPQSAQSTRSLGGDYTGLFLYPKLKQTVILVPPLPSLQNGLFSSQTDNPLRVPFFGIYWVFRHPELAPMPDSFRGEGDPEGMNLRSMDGRPLRVEARQNFGRIIDLRCCSRIQLQVRNNDRYPGTIRVELLLRDSRVPKLSMVSLGSYELRSTQRFRLYDYRPAVQETVDYAVPRGAAPFDEAVVRFHLDHTRDRRAAKVAVEAFVFVPYL